MVQIEERDRWLAEHAEKILEVLEFAQNGIMVAEANAPRTGYDCGKRDRARILAIHEMADRYCRIVAAAGPVFFAVCGTVSVGPYPTAEAATAYENFGSGWSVRQDPAEGASPPATGTEIMARAREAEPRRLLVDAALALRAWMHKHRLSLDGVQIRVLFPNSTAANEANCAARGEWRAEESHHLLQRADYPICGFAWTFEAR